MANQGVCSLSETHIPVNHVIIDQDAPKFDGFSEELKNTNEIIVFNLSGTKFEVLKSNFACWPTTRLSRLIRAKTKDEILSLCDGVVTLSPGNRKEYYFNQEWTNFNSVLDLYRNKQLHSPMHICSMSYHTDLKYWGIDELLLDPCCSLKHYPDMDQSKKETERGLRAKQKQEERIVSENFGSSWIGQTRKFFLNLTEYPETSSYARVSLYMIS